MTESRILVYIAFPVLAILCGVLSDRRTMGTSVPFKSAFGATFLGLLLLVPGLLGCRLHKSDWFLVGCAPWSETVLWPEIWIGLTVLLVAAYFWRKALQSLP